MRPDSGHGNSENRRQKHRDFSWHLATGAAVPCRMPSATRQQLPAEPSTFNVLTIHSLLLFCKQFSVLLSVPPVSQKPRTAGIYPLYPLLAGCFHHHPVAVTTGAEIQPRTKRLWDKEMHVEKCKPCSGPTLMAALTEQLLPETGSLCASTLLVHTAEISSRSSQLKAVKSIAIHRSNVCFARRAGLR